MKAAFYTLGCKVNQYESQIMEQKLSAAGFTIVHPTEPADVYIINSCTVTAESDRKTRQAVHRLKKLNPSALTVLTGCFPQSSPEAAEEIDYVDVVTGTKGRGDIVRLISEALETGHRIVQVTPFEKGERFESAAARGFSEHTRAFVKIEDGCSRYCSYCIIPFARGPVRSKPLSALTQELSVLAGNGFQEAVLVGINLSAYGSDIASSLGEAIEAACAVEGIRRVRLGSLEPNLIDSAFMEEIKAQPKLCPHFHLSLQSGCAETLRRMNRHYTPEEYREAVARLREAIPGCAITTDVIVGFPGETREEFKKSLAFVTGIGFAQAHVFAYSRRDGTKAAALPGQVEKREKERRSHIMIDACLSARRQFLGSHIGRILPVLFETRGDQGEAEGFAPDYTPVKIKKEPGAQALTGRIGMVRVTGCTQEACLGELLQDPVMI